VRVEIDLDSNHTEVLVKILANSMSDEVVELARKISEYSPMTLVGFREEEATLLEHSKVVRFYTANQKVYVVTHDGEYTVRVRLYELEQKLPTNFVRISNTEIINLNEVKGFDLNMVGTVCVKFKDGTTVYTSRRYASKIKQILGM